VEHAHIPTLKRAHETGHDIGLGERSEIDFVLQACVLVEELAPIFDPDDELGLSTLRPRKPMRLDHDAILP
jgi:hypothetical protein